MNYEEMLNTQEGMSLHKEETPFGLFYRKQIEKKFHYVLDLKPELMDNIVFCEGLKTDQEQASKLKNANQLRYVLHSDSGGVYELELEQGTYMTFAQLIDTSPALVAKPGFIDNTISSLMKAVVSLNEQGVYHLCFAPQNLFARKGDNEVLMLCHGSSFLKMSDDSQLYKGYESFVAPEVMNNEGGNERSDVYSLAKFIEWLFKHGGLSYEYKKVIAKATKSDPMQRYASVSEMEQALRRHRNTKRSVLSFVGAVLIALFVVFLYFELMPKVEPIEFVKGVEPDHKEDLLDGGFNPDTELGVWDDDVDPADTLSPEERKSMEEYQAKAEEIFKKRFTKEADRIIGTIYSKDRMNLSEHVFVQSNSKMADELLKIQGNLAEEAGISEEKANKIASGIIDNIMAEKEKTVERYGVQKADKDQSE